MIAGIIIAVLIASYVVGVLLLDAKRRKKGKPSIFFEPCSEEGKGKRLVREFHKLKAKEAKTIR